MDSGRDPVEVGSPPWSPLPDAALAPRHPVVILAGGMGSGKTELAVNLSLRLAAGGETVRLVDLDFVKPFFRSREALQELEAGGVRLIVPPGEQFYSDLPVVLPEVRGMLAARQGVVLVDVGGDGLGSRVLSSFADVLPSGTYELWLVVNTRRPFATDARSLDAMILRIREASGLTPTGVVANSHLLDETDVDTVHEGYMSAQGLATRLGVPVRMLACLEHLVPDLLQIPCPVLPLRRVMWMPGTRPAPLPGARPRGSRPSGEELHAQGRHR